MATLTLKLNGEQLARIDLESGQEYIAGRAPDAQIKLENQRGISRHHLKFFERDGVWVCESLSKFVHIQRGAESMDVIELHDLCAFTVTPFEFIFEPTPVEAQVPGGAEDKPVENNANGPFRPRLGSGEGVGGGGGASNNLPATLSPQPGGGEHTAPRANNDATVAGGASLVPYVRISFPNTADDEVLKLEGHLWVAGRDPDCEITIDSPHVSRKHFELARTNAGYFVTDLGSSNGTRINGNKIPAHEPTQLTSGDEIRVQNVTLTFEIRDIQFANRMDRLPVPVFDPIALDNPWGGMGHHNYPQLASAPTEYRSSEDSPKGWRRLPKRDDWKKNKLRVALIGALLVIGVAYLLPGKKVEDATLNSQSPQGTSPNFEALTKEQKLAVKDSFNLATNLYTQGKYALCLTELAKLHEIIPIYANSKDLQSYCDQGLALTRKQEEQIRRERERAEIEEKVKSGVESCKDSLPKNATVSDVTACLGGPMELAPEHPLILEMIHAAQIRENEAKFVAQQKEVEEGKTAKGRAVFARAMKTYEAGHLNDAIFEFEKFLKVHYPHTEDLREKANREIQSIKKERQEKVNKSLEQCKTLGGKSAFRDAYKACDLAVKEDPENTEAKSTRDKMLSQLRREMKSIYEDSVIEESMGNGDTAKEKWKKILQDDLEIDDYYVKAKSKLQKYGIGD